MAKQLNPDVTTFLDELNHPFRKEIEALRSMIIKADPALTENIKWNGPNYTLRDTDCITMKIQPPKQIQLIFHRGAKVKTQPKGRLIADTTGLLSWKENDRAVATFKSMADITNAKSELPAIVKAWTRAIG